MAIAICNHSMQSARLQTRRNQLCSNMLVQTRAPCPMQPHRLNRIWRNRQNTHQSRIVSKLRRYRCHDTQRQHLSVPDIQGRSSVARFHLPIVSILTDSPVGGQEPAIAPSTISISGTAIRSAYKIRICCVKLVCATTRESPDTDVAKSITKILWSSNRLSSLLNSADEHQLGICQCCCVMNSNSLSIDDTA